MRPGKMKAAVRKGTALFLVWLLLLPFIAPTFGIDRFVDPTGTDSGPGSIVAPWLTLDYASANSLPGDNIYVNNGTYLQRWTIGSLEGGTSGNPKRYIASNPLMVTNVGGFTVSQGAGEIRWDGMVFQDGAANPDWEGLCQFYHSSGGVSLGANFVFSNCVFEGVQDATTHNIPLIHMDPPNTFSKYAEGFTMTNCVLKNASQWMVSVYVANGSIGGCYLDFANTHDALHIWGTNLWVIGNTITNISQKVGVSDHTDIFQFWWGTATSPSTNVFITRNLIINSGAQFFQVEGDDTSMNNPGPVGGIYVWANIWKNVQHHGSIDVPDFHVWNNTFYQCDMSDGAGQLLFFAGSGNAKGESKRSTFRNNAIISGNNTSTTGMYDASELGVPENFIGNYNFFANANFTAKNISTLTGNGMEANAVNGGDPKFVDAANGDFHLQAGSPLIDAGTTITGLPISKSEFAWDYYGTTRTGTWDIGAVESGGGGGGGGGPAAHNRVRPVKRRAF